MEIEIDASEIKKACLENSKRYTEKALTDHPKKMPKPLRLIRKTQRSTTKKNYDFFVAYSLYSASSGFFKRILAGMSSSV